MLQNNGSFRKLCWRFLVLLILVGTFILLTPQHTVRATDCMDTYNDCTYICSHQNPPLTGQDLQDCYYSCEQNSSYAGCFSDGNEAHCNTLYYLCPDLYGDDIGNCYQDYADCEYAVASEARSHYVMLHGMDLEPDDPCLVAARDDYWSCLDGNNNLCITNNVVQSGCCEAERSMAFSACYGSYGP